MAARDVLAGEQQFSIGRAAEICGTTPSTLRSWERRYGFPTPPRRDSGHRVYTRAEIELLRNVVARTSRGLSVSLAIDDVRGSLRAASHLPSQEPDDLVERFVAAVQAMEIAQARESLRQAWELLDWESVARGFVTPAMRRIGDLWESGQLSLAAEHMASSLVRTQILSLIRFLGEPAEGPLAICACAPKEQHDLGLLLLSAELRRRGWQVIYLGAAVPVEELATAAALAGPFALFVSATTAAPLRALRRLPQALLAHGQGRLHVLIGGAADESARLPEGGAIEFIAVEALPPRLDALASAWRVAPRQHVR